MFFPYTDVCSREDHPSEINMNRAFVNLLTDDVEKSAQFYEDLLGMTRAGDFGWFVVLTHPHMPTLELGVLDRHHATVPDGIPPAPGGAMLTFVVSDIVQIHARAGSMGADIVATPHDTPYGQRRLLVRDPTGTMVDVSSPIRD